MFSVRAGLTGVLVMLLLVGLSYLLGDVIDRHWMDVHVRGHGLGGELLFLITAGLFAGVGLSRQVIAFLGGYSFGFLTGTLLGLAATLLGCMAAFYTARLLGRRFLKPGNFTRIRKVDNFIRSNTFTMTLLIRLLPVGSNWMVNLAAGVSSVRGLPFFSASAIGYIPQMLVFALVGSGTRVEQYWQIAIAIALFMVSTLLGMYVYRNYRNGKSLDEELDNQLG